MKIIELTQGKSTIVDDDTYVWAANYKWHYLKCNVNGYAARRGRKEEGINYKKYIFLHQEILERRGEVLNAGEEVDHIDGNKLNNVSSNIRKVTHQQNGCNYFNKEKSTTGYKGVQQKWSNYYRARIAIDQVQIHIGYFRTAKEAAVAYDKEAIKYHKEFAYLNFPENKELYLKEVGDNA